MSFRIIDIDPNNSPEELLNKYYDLVGKLHLEQSPKDPLPSRDVLFKRMEVKNIGEVRIIKLFFQKLMMN